MTRTFKKKDLLYLKRVLIRQNSEKNDEMKNILIGICSYLSHEDYRDFAPHETGKILINK